MMLMIMIMLMMLFPMMKHTLSMGLILILQTITISMLSGMMINSFLFSYMLLISMLSDMLVLFTYMASIASNKKFSTSKTAPIPKLIVLMKIIVLINQEEINLNYMELPKIMSYSYDQLMPKTKMFYYPGIDIHNYNYSKMFINHHN